MSDLKIGVFGRLVAAIALMCPLVVDAIPKVVVSIMPVHSLVAGVMTGVGVPELLIPGNQSPHTFSLSPSSVRRLGAADLVVWVGGQLETPLAKVLKANVEDAPIIELITLPGLERLPVREAGGWDTHGHDGSHDRDDHASQAHPVDPHIWLSPVNAVLIATRIFEVLSDMDPTNADAYHRNTVQLIQRIAELDNNIEASFASVRDRPYIVFHDAYQLFEHHYRLRAVGSVTVNPERLPGARTISEVRSKIVKSGARCVFSEPQFEPRLVATLIEGTRARAGTLDPVGYGLSPGPDAYFLLMTGLATAIIDCLSE
ncbi:MAG: zinc ABC transporter substrate-binding protein [Gammaproteobacteria bacterium]|nr:zinc ABC transporter substrate-binding protein [Gammaproteobacteria bacterium]